MKRGQLAAVIIMVLLVAAVGGFIIFSEKRAGQAGANVAPSKTVTYQPTYPSQTPTYTQPYPVPSGITYTQSKGQPSGGQPVMAIPVPKGYQPPIGVLPCVSNLNCPSGFVCANFICVPGQQPPAGQPSSGAQPPSQPQPPVPQPPAPKPPEGPVTVTPTGEDTATCSDSETTILCGCQVSLSLGFSCTKDLPCKTFYPERDGVVNSEICYPTTTKAGQCYFPKRGTFTITVPGDLCGKEDASKRAEQCSWAAKLKPECQFSPDEKASINKKLEECASSAKGVCMSLGGSFSQKLTPEEKFFGYEGLK